MTSRRQESRRLAGFTLVEVLVTVLIMSLVMLSITMVLNRSRITRDQIHNIQERQLAGPAILQRIERDLRSLVSYNRDPSEVLRVRDRVLSGLDADTIDFVASVDGLLPYREHAGEDFRRADFNEVGCRLRPNPTSDDFLEIYRREDFGVDEEPFDGGNFALLHDRVKGFNIEVFEEDGPDAEPLDGWGTDEDEFSGLPTRLDIELTIELAPRLIREQILVERRTMVYRRTFRFPESQRLAMETQIVPRIPNIQPPTAEEVAGGTGAAGEGEGEGEGEAGGADRGGDETGFPDPTTETSGGEGSNPFGSGDGGG